MRARLALAGVVLLAGCSLAPAYDVPPSLAAPMFKEADGWQAAANVPAPPGRWWDAFGDPVLSALEDRIERGNPSLAAAVARYDEARETLGVARAARLPTVDAAGSAERAHVSAARPLATTGAQTYDDLRVGPSVAYELDLFGRVRSSVRASAADAQAGAADVAGVRLGLQASLADAYFQMRGLDARIVLLRQSVAAFQRAYDLTATRHTGGIASGIDVSRSTALLASARAEQSAVAGDRAAFEHAIAVLVGESPSTFAIIVVDGQALPPDVPAGIPSTLLQRRPDIAAAERRIAAANARIGVARAALFPAITLDGSAGFEAGSAALLQVSAGYWALGPLTTALSIFDGGARRARVRIARAQFYEAAANYRSTVLTAFREVEDDLARTRADTAQEREQAAATLASGRTRDLALIRYRDGASDYLDVVTAQTAALDAERLLLTVRTERLRLAVDTARAIGGGGPT